MPEAMESREYIRILNKKDQIPPASISIFLLEFMPINISEYGQKTPFPVLFISSPRKLPISAIPIGREKLRMSMDNKSWRAPIAIPASVPRNSHKMISGGISPGSPQNLPQPKYNMQSQNCVTNVVFKITASLARKTQEAGTGAVIRTLQLLFKCSRRHRYEQYSPISGA